MNRKDLVDVWNVQYGDERDTALKDRNLFSIEVDALKAQVIRNLPATGPVRILELGCGTGYLLQEVGRLLESRGRRNYRLVGVDFARNAIDTAVGRSLRNTDFECGGFAEFFGKTREKFDLILSQRSVMALMSDEEQSDVLQQICEALAPEGVVIIAECFRNGFDRFNDLREQAGLEPIDKVWHSRHVDESALEKIFGQVEFVSYCSTYMLVTRLVYPFFEDPVHNHAIHDLAARLPESGDHAFLKIAVLRV